MTMNNTANTSDARPKVRRAARNVNDRQYLKFIDAMIEYDGAPETAPAPRLDRFPYYRTPEDNL